MDAGAIRHVVVVDGLGMSGELILPADLVENITVPASTSQHQLLLPYNTTTAKFMAITATKITDLSVQVSTDSGSTVLQVPKNTTLILYTVNALYVNSTLGGTFRVITG